MKSQLYLTGKGEPDKQANQPLRRKVTLQTVHEAGEQGEGGGREAGPEALDRHDKGGSTGNSAGLRQADGICGVVALDGSV